VAIASVLALHFLCSTIVPTNALERIVARVTSYGSWGVDLFFVLSGYLITGILYDTRESPSYFRSFYGRRTLRIFPLYYGILLAILVLVPRGLADLVTPELSRTRGVQGWLWSYLTNVYLARTGSFSIPYVSHFWSLAVEEHFYLVWPLVVRHFSRVTLMRICVGAAVASVALRIVLARAGVNEVAAYTLTPCRLDTLCIGAWFVLWSRGPEAADQARRLQRSLWLVGAATFVVSVVRMHTPSWERELLALREGLVGAFFGLLVAAAAAPKQFPRWTRLLRVRWLAFLGKYSYGLYVFHGIVAYAWGTHGVPDRLARALGSYGLAIAAQAALGIGLSTALAVASFHLYEKRFLGLKRFFEAAPTRREGRVAGAI
jgi:peptidoglycan/LPS O-acetylase OafA/YrhL